MSEPSEIISALAQCGRVLVSVHKSPDGDAIGSQLALVFAIEKLGKTVVAHNLDPVPETYRFLPQWERIRTGNTVEGRFDVVVVLDSDPNRTGLFDKGYPAGVQINIDHHITNAREWPLTWLDSNASATAEMIYELIRKLGVSIDRSMAVCLYTAIFTDTGSFRYSNTTSKSMRIAAEMMDAGADPRIVTENVYESLAFRRIKLLGSVLEGIERSEDGRIAWVVVTDELYRRSGASAEDTDNFVNFVRSVKGVEVAVLLRQTGETEYKISLRSKGRVDLSRLAQALGGGGHKNAAGGILKGSLSEVKNKVITEINNTIISQLERGEPEKHGRRP